MAFIDTVPAAEAEEEILAFYRRQQGRLGYLPNYAKLYCHRPAVMDAWAALQKELRRNLDDRSYSLITVAAARAMGNSYCSIAHGRKLLTHGIAEQDLVNLFHGNDVESVTEAEEVMMRLAAKVARDAASVSEHDIEDLKEHGFTDAQVFDVVAAASARCFFSRIPDALGAKPDAPLGEMDPELLELLCVGRPLSEEEPESVP